MPSLVTIRSNPSKRFYQSGGLDVVTDIDANFTVLNNAIAQKALTTVGVSTGADYVCDGVADDVQIQQAIDAANAAGGGIVVLKFGAVFSVSNEIEMKSNVSLWMHGATLRACFKSSSQASRPSMSLIIEM